MCSENITGESSTIVNANDLIENNEFILRLERSKKNLVNSASPGERMSSQLLHMATTSIIMPTYTPSKEQIQVYLIDEYLNFNSLFLLPFRSLMLNRFLDAHLKDAIVSSICEIVESSAYKIKTSWNCLFTCISKLDLNSHLKQYHKSKRKTRKNKRKSSKQKKLKRSKKLRKTLVSQTASLNGIGLTAMNKSRLKSFDSASSCEFGKSFESFASNSSMGNDKKFFNFDYI